MSKLWTRPQAVEMYVFLAAMVFLLPHRPWADNVTFWLLGALAGWDLRNRLGR